MKSTQAKPIAPNGAQRARRRVLLPIVLLLPLSAPLLAHDRDWHEQQHRQSHGSPHAHDGHHDHEPPYEQDRRHQQQPYYGGYWQGVANAALTFGGERLATVEVDTRFSGVESEDIRAGELFMFGGGLLYTDGNFGVVVKASNSSGQRVKLASPLSPKM
ncbi:MAG: hypothetical protein HKO07_07525, partial [Pseudomonadales bacterium]|nr:hypothetical protein [Pseudomonadales bacterium]